MDKHGNLSEDIPGSNRQAEEEHWIKAIRADDKGAFKRMFGVWYDPLLRFAFRYVNSEVIAEGLVQNVFLWIWENRKEWHVEGKLNTYLFRAVKYKAMDYWRHERTREQYLKRFSESRASYIDPVPYEPDESEFVRAAQQAIEYLPERARMVYKLSRLEGLTYCEIAEVLEISPKTVETHMSRALDFLRKRLSRYLSVLSAFGFIGEILP